MGVLTARTGCGVFHIGFVVDNVDNATEQVHALGLETWMSGVRPKNRAAQSGVASSHVGEGQLSRGRSLAS
jgi:hypothetical protein